MNSYTQPQSYTYVCSVHGIQQAFYLAVLTRITVIVPQWIGFTITFSYQQFLATIKSQKTYLIHKLLPIRIQFWKAVTNISSCKYWSKKRRKAARKEKSQTGQLKKRDLICQIKKENTFREFFPVFFPLCGCAYRLAGTYGHERLQHILWTHISHISHLHTRLYPRFDAALGS